MDDGLARLYDRLWSDLEGAAQDTRGEHPLRALVLSTVGATGIPQSRFLILREVDRARLTLRFHTDIRSAKWREVAAQPAVSVLGYASGSREQLRLVGRAERFGVGSPEQDAAWRALPAWTRTTYCGGPPGHAIAAPEEQSASDSPPPLSELEIGRDRFGLLDVIVHRLEWYQHPRNDIRRAVFDCTPGKDPLHAQWIEP